MRLIAAAALAALMAGCTTVKVAQRDGCWVRQTSKFMGSSKEEVGPCMRAQPAWVADRYTRLVQECVAESDHRWTVFAIAAWERGEALPAQPPQDKVLEMCMSEASTAMVTENERLRQQLGLVEAQRLDMAKRFDNDRSQYLSANAKLADFLGEAAKKASTPAVATATATSDGKASSENGSSTRTASDTRFSGSSMSDSGAKSPHAPGAQLKARPLGKANCAPEPGGVAKGRARAIEPKDEVKPTKASADDTADAPGSKADAVPAE